LRKQLCRATPAPLETFEVAMSHPLSPSRQRIALCHSIMRISLAAPLRPS
jgi:hypothetical protein